jgi:hypothetical protein
LEIGSHYKMEILRCDTDRREGCTLHMKNWIWGRCRIDDNGQLVTSNSDIISILFDFFSNVFEFYFQIHLNFIFKFI